MSIKIISSSSMLMYDIQPTSSLSTKLVMDILNFGEVSMREYSFFALRMYGDEINVLKHLFHLCTFVKRRMTIHACSF